MAHGAENRSRFSPKRTSPFKSAGESVQSTAGSRGVRISGSNAGYTTFRGRVKSTGYPLHSPVSPSLPLPCVTVCHHIPNAVYQRVHSVQGISDESRRFYLALYYTVPTLYAQLTLILTAFTTATFTGLCNGYTNNCVIKCTNRC